MAQPKPRRFGYLSLAAMFHRPVAVGDSESSEGLTHSNAALGNIAASPLTGTLHDGRMRSSDFSNVDMLKPQASFGSSSPHLSRSGLLQPMSYKQPSSIGSSDNSMAFGQHHSDSPHSQDTIRESTMELSSISFSSTSPINALSSSGEYPLPSAVLRQPNVTPIPTTTSPLPRAHSRQSSGDATPRLPPQPSGLSLLRHEYEAGSNSGSEGSRTPTASAKSKHSPELASITPGLSWPDVQKTTSPAVTTPITVTPSPPPIPTETTPLIRRIPSSPVVSSPQASTGKPIYAKITSALPHTMEVAFKSIPAVLLGCLLNILDGVSYGMIIFPGTGVFSSLGPMGVSMFFLSTVIAQVVYTLGGSGFAGANGSMMIEVVPFFHILANDIARLVGEDNPKEVIATTLAAFTLSSILTGLTFFVLGALKLGVLIGFFPRHILVGCIGGVGAFLIQTGFTVSMRIGEDDLNADWKTFEMMFLNTHNLTLWVVPLILAVLLRAITHKFHHQLIFPIYFLVIPAVFYVVVAGLGLDLWDLRRTGWIFDMGTGESEVWYKFYSYWDFRSIRFGALLATLPTQFALLFFNILHPPLNVPALSVSLDEDIDTDKELVSHGYSNLLSGLFGTVPNYLVYVNTLLFYRVGGNTRIAGFLLAIMNAVLLVIGTAPIAYIPVMVVGSLIFVLGIDLVKEALWDTRHRTSRTEYITIVSIVVFMTVWDFVVGVIWGIIASCFFFVVQNSQRRSIRSLHSGETAMSTVRRPSLQRAYLREVSKQTTIIKLQGFLFFGTINHVEDTIRDTVEGPAWHNNPIRFLVLDFSLVAGVDMSSSEAFVRMHRFFSAKSVTIVFCGFPRDSAVAQALKSVHVLGADNVEHFLSFNDAMEWTENAYLRAWYMAQKYEVTSTAFAALPGRHHREYDHSSEQHSLDSFVSSPRRSYMRDVGNRTIANENHRVTAESEDYLSEPQNTLVKAFSSYGDIDIDLFRPISKYLERMSLPESYVLWRQGDPSDGLYIVEAGVLRASYKFADHLQDVEESMVPGTVAGELSALSALPRNATVVVERPAILWKLSAQNLVRMETEEPKLARYFVRLILKAAKIDHDILLSALASRQ